MQHAAQLGKVGKLAAAALEEAIEQAKPVRHQRQADHQAQAGPAPGHQGPIDLAQLGPEERGRGIGHVRWLRDRCGWVRPKD